MHTDAMHTVDFPVCLLPTFSWLERHRHFVLRHHRDSVLLYTVSVLATKRYRVISQPPLGDERVPPTTASHLLHLLQEAPTYDKTGKVKNTNNPEYDAKFMIAIDRGSRSMMRIFRRQSIKCEVWERG